MGAVLAVQPQRLDPIVTPLPWIPYVLPKKLRIGIVRHNGIVRPHPPIVRVIDQTAELLKAQGHEGESDLKRIQCSLAGQTVKETC